MNDECQVCGSLDVGYCRDCSACLCKDHDLKGNHVTKCKLVVIEEYL